MPETIKTGNVTTAAEESRRKIVESGDQIPELPLACWRGHESRVDKCREHFRKTFNAAPTFYCRVPGR